MPKGIYQRRSRAPMIAVKKCGDCKVELPNAVFYKNIFGKHGCKSYCAVSVNIAHWLALRILAVLADKGVQRTSRDPD